MRNKLRLSQATFDEKLKIMDDAEIPLKIKQLGHSAQDITSKVYTQKTIE